VAEIQEFITGVRPMHPTDRVVATVLFTDIVDSTKRAAMLGDHAWRELLGTFERMAVKVVAAASGRLIKSTGDGILATFDGPARGVRCAQATLDAVRRLSLEARAGLHTGEIELARSDIRGIAVHLAARVASSAGPGEVRVSSTVRDLVAGSGITFDDRGEHSLKGVPGVWRLFSAR
jgi:class 3 adenylate cyclase